jgi:tetratricopeptide (TPR) repeat protein
MKTSTAGALLLMLAAAGGVAAVQPRLAKTMHEVKERDDVVVFPPPAQLRAAVLGYDAAAVDVLWSTLLVEYGEHFSEHRDFTQIPRYIDAILELEPTYWPLYNFVDTMLAYRPMQGTADDIVRARAYLEKGTRERPQDPRIWSKLGQFIAFIAPSFLKDPQQIEAWRKDGADAMAHATELGADPDQLLAASFMMSRSGATREAIHYLERAYAFTEHPAMHEIHEAIGKRLEALQASRQRDEADAVEKAIRARWTLELPAVSRGQYVLLGPVPDPARCAGVAASETVECSRSWARVIAAPESSEGSP